jgi:hypothetical protein
MADAGPELLGVHLGAARRVRFVGDVALDQHPHDRPPQRHDEQRHEQQPQRDYQHHRGDNHEVRSGR